MNAIDIVFLPEALPFSVALMLMVMLGAISAIGFDIDHDMDSDVHIPLLDYMNPGRLPLMMSFVVFLATYGVVGIAGQELAFNLIGHTFNTLPAALGAAPIALIASNPVSRLLGRILPRDETSAITLDELVGTRGQIEIGTSKKGAPARACFKDRHGQAHYLMVEPQNDSHEYPKDTEVLLVNHSAAGSQVIAAGAWPSVSL